MAITIDQQAFQVTADVPEIYMQEFWATAKLHHNSICFKIDTKKSVLDLEAFREMLHISPRIPNQSFVDVPTEEEILDFLSESAFVEEPVQTTCQMEEPSHSVFETGADDQPIVQTSQHPEWFSQP
nr:hypothetical protein [Tanacetum cinerariifolium]